MTDEAVKGKDFIREMIDHDNEIGKHNGRVHTRFPPEPNGYLHIGHAKSICLNFGIAQEYDGLCNLRFDDTNPSKEDEEYVESIKEDIKWLGFDWEDRIYFASDYFQEMYDYAEDLIKKGKAYVDDQSAEEISKQRGSFIQPGVNSPYHNRSVEENLDLFRRMGEGEFQDGDKVLRAKIDMSHPNLNMRDPIMYRILHKTHHHTGDKWCIYPSYDWAHGLEDSIERITHSLCTLEFENHRPLYDWFLIELGVYRPQQTEFARLNLTYTVMSKRKLLDLVERGYVNGWDDPRLPTLSGLRRRGYSPESIRDLCARVGIAKVNSTIAIELLESCVRDHLNRTAPRFMGVLDPLKVVMENYPEDKEEDMDVIINPEEPELGTRTVKFTKEIYIEQSDFMEDPPKKFFRLTKGREVRLRNAYLITCTDVIKEGDKVVELRCTVDPETKGGNAPDGRRVRGTLHWVSAKYGVDAEIRLYDRLFTVEDPLSQDKGEFFDYLSLDSLNVLKGCKVDPALQFKESLFGFQFERTGYFCIDPDTTEDKLVINRTVGLRDTWKKIQKQMKNRKK